MIHQEPNTIPAFAASKAFIYFLNRRNSEGGGLLIMKRTKTQVISPSLFKFDKRAHNIDNIDPGKYLLYGSLRNQL